VKKSTYDEWMSQLLTYFGITEYFRVHLLTAVLIGNFYPVV